MGALLSHNFDEGYKTQLRKIKETVSPKQIEKFKDAAHERETDDRGEVVDDKLKKVAKVEDLIAGR